MNKKRFILKNSEQSGVTLVEVLISMFIISFAVVGAAALQIESLKNALAMEHRAQATFLANDMLERMRASKRFGLDPYVTSISAQPNASVAQAGQTLSQLCAVNNTADVRQDDLKEWGCLVTNTLPTGTARIVVDNDNSFVTLNFGWVQRPISHLGSAQNMSFVIEARI